MAARWIAPARRDAGPAPPVPEARVADIGGPVVGLALTRSVGVGHAPLELHKLPHPIVSIADNRQGIVGERLDVRRQVPGEVAHGSRPLDDGGLGGGDVVDVAHGGKKWTSGRQRDHAGNPALMSPSRRSSRSSACSRRTLLRMYSAVEKSGCNRRTSATAACASAVRSSWA